MWPIALETLVADRGKLATALIGVIFSVALVNVQGGLFLGLTGKAGLLVDVGEADIWVGHRSMHNVDFPRDIPYEWIERVRAVPGVKRAEPYIIGHTQMAIPDGSFEQVVVVGVDRNSFLGNVWNLTQGSPQAILETDGVIIDEWDMKKLGFPKVGDVRELGGKRAKIVGTSRGVIGFLVTPYVFTTYERAAAYSKKSADVCSYYLVEVNPAADIEQVCRAIRQRVPQLEACPKDQYSRISVDFWMTRTGMGISFGAATLLGLFVGMVIVAQTLYTLVLDRLVEFGALKALGASGRQIYSILLAQATVMAMAGSLIGLGVVGTIQQLFNTPIAPIVIPWWLSMGSCLLVLAICLGASTLPYWRIRKLDPLIVLQS